jgi:hypothetical protein
VVLVALALTAPEAQADAESRHLRIRTARGAVHVWTPAGFDADTAGIVVYVHGYYVDVDDAWRDHQLAKQFADSGLNALFVACEAPRGPSRDVPWPALPPLLATVARGLRARLPDGKLIAIGHSGAHRTLSLWLEDKRLDTVVLVDAHYGELPQLRSWILASPERRLIDVADLTRPWTDELHASLPETVVYDEFPDPDAGRLAGARDAQIVYVRSRLGHMPLVTGGIALPMILRALRLPMVGDASRTDPLRPL